MTKLCSHNLPVSESLIKAYKTWYGITDHLPKKSRFTLGARIDATFLNTLELAFTAGVLPKDKKEPYVKKALLQLDLLKLLLRISWEIKALDNQKYLLISTPVDEIGRMLGGWQRRLESEVTGRGEPDDRSDSSCSPTSPSRDTNARHPSRDKEHTGYRSGAATFTY